MVCFVNCRHFQNILMVIRPTAELLLHTSTLLPIPSTTASIGRPVTSNSTCISLHLIPEWAEIHFPSSSPISLARNIFQIQQPWYKIACVDHDYFKQQFGFAMWSQFIHVSSSTLIKREAHVSSPIAFKGVKPTHAVFQHSPSASATSSHVSIGPRFLQSYNNPIEIHSIPSLRFSSRGYSAEWT